MGHMGLGDLPAGGNPTAADNRGRRALCDLAPRSDAADLTPAVLRIPNFFAPCATFSYTYTSGSCVLAC